MVKIKQYRYGFNPQQHNSLPSKVDNNNICGVNFFKDLKGEVIKLGIQATPGTIFRLNGGEYPLTVGHTGIYELDVDGLTVLTSLVFNTIPDRLLVDIVYRTGE